MKEQLPPLPQGYHRWEPRPAGWKTDTPAKYAFRNHHLPNPQWQVMPGTMIPFGDPKCDYLEAVREQEPLPSPESAETIKRQRDDLAEAMRQIYRMTIPGAAQEIIEKALDGLKEGTP